MDQAPIMQESVDMTLIIVLMVAFIFFAITYAVSKNLSAYNVSKRRIRELKARRTELRDAIQGSKRRSILDKKKKKEEEENIEFMQKVVKKLNLVQENTVNDLKALLESAGYRSKNAVIKYSFAQGVCSFGFLAFSLLFVEIDTNNMSGVGILKLGIPFIAVYAGFWLPKILVINTRTKRYQDIIKGLPDGLDLMMICTEAGLTLSAALDRVSQETNESYPVLAEELALTSLEIGFLPEKRTAFENLAKRVDIPEIRALTSILIQTEKYGTPVSNALRVLAKEFRTQRMLRAEQKAAQLPAIMTVPLIMFILPTMFIIVIAPAVIGIMNSG